MDKKRHEQQTIEDVTFQIAWRHYKGKSNEWRCSATVKHEVDGQTHTEWFNVVDKNKSEAREKLLRDIRKYLEGFDN